MVSDFSGSENRPVSGLPPPAENPAQGPRNWRCLTANGATDSHAVTLKDGEPNPSPRAGQPYSTIPWSGIRERAATPTAHEKNKAPFVILSTYAECDGRTHAVQRERGEFWGLAVDIDAGNPPLSDIESVVRDVAPGAEAIIYSSSSAAPDDRKWRILIPLASPLPGADYPETQTAFFNLLEKRGLRCDVSLARTGQPIYLPNVPPKRRGPDGRPFFYESRHIEGELLDLASGTTIVKAREDLRAKRSTEKVAAAAKAEAYHTKRLAYVQATGDDFEPIAHFKSNNTIAERLAQYGFDEHPRLKNHYRSPLSESGSYSTEDCGDYWVTVSAWAHKHNVGRITKSGNRYGDAFDLFVHFEHGGDRRAAIRAYAASLGRDYDGLEDKRPTIVEKLPDRGPARSLDEWRFEMKVTRDLALRVPGLHLDRSPTGSGKTFATTRGIRDAINTTAREAELDDTITPITKTLTVLPDHANIRERVREMRAEGLEAVAYPARDETTCGNLEAVRQAEAFGLNAGAAVCWRCDLFHSCVYQRQVAEAEAADHAVGTHERLRLSPDTTTRGRDALIIDELPEAVLAPSISVRVDDFNPVVGLASIVRDEWLFRHGQVMGASAEEREFARQLVETHARIVEAARDATEPGVIEIPLPPPPSAYGPWPEWSLAPVLVPENWQTTILRWAAETGITPGDDRHKRERFQKSLRLLMMIVTGKLEHLYLLVDRTSRHERQRDGSVKESEHLHHFVVGSWRTNLPDVPTLLLDATADADGLRAATGCEVRDCTPEGYLPNIAPVVQVPWDVTASQSPSTAAGFVEAILTNHPEVDRLGLIGHQDHIRAIMDRDDVLPPRLRARIAKACWFGAGPDRASNDWHEVCDALLVVGTMRPGGGPVKERLVLHGKIDAARRDGDWGIRQWAGVTLDGREVVIEGKGYRDPDWHAAHVSICRAAIHQAAGRGRAVTDKGIPVWIISDEPMGVPIDDSIQPVSPVVREVVEAVRAIRDGGAGTELFPIGTSYKRKFGSQVAVRVAAVIGYLKASAGAASKPLGQRAIEKRLRLAVYHGRLERPAKGWLIVPEDAPDQPLLVTATAPPETVTIVCTATAPKTIPPALDGLFELIDERAAILESDAGFDRETADRLARDMVMGTTAITPMASSETVGVDHATLQARMNPLVVEATKRFGGAVRLIPQNQELFSAGWGARAKARKRPDGSCSCGSCEVEEVRVHGGQSSRHDCAACGKFIRYVVWYGKPVTAAPQRQSGEPASLPNPFSFLSPPSAEVHFAAG